LLYVGLQVFGALATSLLVVAFVRGLGVAHGVAYLAAVPPVTVAMFVANRLWTFRERPIRVEEAR
jgi:putative flippase GtrA